MNIRELIQPNVVTLGSILVRRVLPSPERQMVGPFIFMDQAGPTQALVDSEAGVPEHPHAGLATLTYLLEGVICHRDSSGAAAKIYPGDVALMTAGKGITHEELPEPKSIGTVQPVYFVQLWIALPDEYENGEPSFEVHRQAEIPEVEFGGAYAWLLIGDAWSQSAPTTQHSTTILADILIEPQGSVPLLPYFEERALYILEGKARLDAEPLEAHNLALLQPGGKPTLRSEEGCRAILLGGNKFRHPRFVLGGFVGSSKEHLERKVRAYRRGDFPKLIDVYPNN